MRKTILLLTITILFSINIVAQNGLIIVGEPDGDGWTKYIDTIREYSIILPAKPDFESETLSSEGSKVILYMLSSKDEDQVYMTGVIDFKTNYTERSDLENFYDGCKEGLEEEFPGAKVTSTNITFKNKFARKVIVESKEYRMDAICVFSNGKLFQMTVLRTNTITDSKIINKTAKLTAKFFESFAETKAK